MIEAKAVPVVTIGNWMESAFEVGNDCTLELLQSVLTIRSELNDLDDWTEAEYNTEFMRCVWAFIERYWDTLQSICAKSCRGRFDLVEEMFSDVVLWRVQNAFHTYKAWRGELEGHVFGTIRWYCFKWMNERLRRVTREPCVTDLQPSQAQSSNHRGAMELEPAASGDIDAYIAHECKEEVQRLLACLDAQHKRIVFLHDGMAWTFDEIGFQERKSESWAKQHYHQAVQLIRERVAAVGAWHLYNW